MVSSDLSNAPKATMNNMDIYAALLEGIKPVVPRTDITDQEKRRHLGRRIVVAARKEGRGEVPRASRMCCEEAECCTRNLLKWTLKRYAASAGCSGEAGPNVLRKGGEGVVCRPRSILNLLAFRIFERYDAM